MASGDIHISVVPAVSAVAPYTRVNEYGKTVTLREKSIASEPALLAEYINSQLTSPTKTLLQVLDGGNRLTLVLKES